MRGRKGRPPCSIASCNKPSVARGWCGLHYDHWRTHGDPEAKVRPRGVTTYRACLVCGKEIRVIAALVKRKKFCSHSCNSIAQIQRGVVRAYSKPECQLAEALSQLGVKYEWQVPLAGYVADFLVRKSRVVIEVDGEYWHALPENVERDAKKDAALSSAGYRVYRIPSLTVVKDAAGAAESLVSKAGLITNGQGRLVLTPHELRVCSVFGCNRPLKARQLCGAHYLRLRIYGDPLAAAPAPPPRYCSVEGCGQPHCANGYCRLHNQRHQTELYWLTHRRIRKPVGAAGPNESVCSVEECLRAAKHLGLCNRHYQQQWRQRRMAA